MTFFMPSSGGRTVFRYRSCMAAACTACVSALTTRGRLALQEGSEAREKKRHRRMSVAEPLVGWIREIEATRIQPRFLSHFSRIKLLQRRS